MLKYRFGLLVFLAAGFALPACGSDDDEGGSGKSGDGDSGSDSFDLDQGDGDSGAPDPFGSDLPRAGILDGVDGRGSSESGGGAITPVLPGDECVGEVAEGELLPLNMLIMMDRSVSMGDSEERYLIPDTDGVKWVETRKGLDEFLELPSARGLGVGIDYFNQGSCDSSDYSTPEVPIQLLPAVAPDVMASYDEWEPGGNTPLSPALEGALTAAGEWKKENPGKRVIVVLVTDGVPNGCGAAAAQSQEALEEATAELAAVARAGFEGDPSVATWVLGIQGQEVSAEGFQFAVESVAQAGGGEPVIVEANDSLASEFSGALDRIRAGAGLPCSYSVPLPPDGAALDLNQVNVLLSPDSFAPEPVFNVPGEDECEAGGWYYDPPGDPEAIKLCQNTCDAVEDLADAQFQVVFGCNTVTVVR